MARSLSLLLLLLTLSNTASAQSSTFLDGNTKRVISWDDMVGKTVTADGLAWGALAKGLGQHLVIPSEQIVYVQNVDYTKHDLNGRLARISGVLRKGRAGGVPPAIQGYTREFDYYYVESLRVNAIDKIQNDQLLPTRSDWVHVGMDEAAAMKLVGKYRGKPYLLSLTAAKDGSAAHSYRFTNGDIVLFYVLRGHVISVTKIVAPDNKPRVAQKWIPLRGYEFPTIE